MGETTERLKGKAEQAVGNVKQGVGKAVGSPRLEAEGRADELRGESREEAAKTAGRVKGGLNEVGGSLKGAVGDALDDPTLEAEGEAQRLKGHTQREANR